MSERRLSKKQQVSEASGAFWEGLLQIISDFPGLDGSSIFYHHFRVVLSEKATTKSKQFYKEIDKLIISFNFLRVEIPSNVFPDANQKIDP